MRCPSCGQVNRAGASFCGECGTSLKQASTCTACGAPNPRQHKFCDSCGRPTGAVEPISGKLPSSEPPVTLAGGRYRVKGPLGEGGTKRVYLAHDARLERDVAVALIKTEGLDERALGRLRREARAMGQLGNHPHIVTVYDIGEDNGQPFIVIQYMEGGSLEGLLARA